jgi:hypothetical protein
MEEGYELIDILPIPGPRLSVDHRLDRTHHGHTLTASSPPNTEIRGEDRAILGFVRFISLLDGAF